jgi:transposase InsO family protein
MNKDITTKSVSFNKANVSSGKGEALQPRSALECFLSKRKLPPYHSNLISKGEKTDNKEKKSSEKDPGSLEYIDFDTTIEGTEVKVKVRIPMVTSLTKDVNKRIFDRFEDLASTNKWDDEQMGRIFVSLVKIDGVTENLTRDSYKSLKGQLLDLRFPKNELNIYKENLEKIRQDNFYFINEYDEEIKEALYAYSYVRCLTKKEQERLQYESFIKGLGVFTTIDVLKQQGFNILSLKEVRAYLQHYEEVVLSQVNRSTAFTAKPENQNQTTQKNLNQKYCQNCKTRTHNTKECYKKPESTMIMEEVVRGGANEVCLPGKLLNTEIRISLDTGATRSFICHELVRQLNITPRETKPLTTMFGSGSTKVTNQCVEINLVLGSSTLKVKCYVMKDFPVKVLLGNDVLFAHEMIINLKRKFVEMSSGDRVKMILPDKTIIDELEEAVESNICLQAFDEQTNKCLENYFKVNSNFSIIKGANVTLNTKPGLDVVQSKGYPVAGKIVPEVKTEIKRLLEEDIVEHSNSIYSSPAFFIRKKTNDVRLVVDYRKINEFIYDDAFQIPNMEYSIRSIGENRYFSTIDLKNGFNQIGLDPESRKYTAFMLMGQQFQYKRIPFGIKPGPKIFQRQISEILRDVEGISVYIDDILIYAKTKDEHEVRLNNVLNALLRYEVKINFEKSSFFQREVLMLGYRINEDGIFPVAADLTDRLLQSEVKSKKDLQSLVGMLNWYRKFVPNLSVRISSITEKLKGKDLVKSFQLTMDEKAELKRIIHDIENSSLGFPDFTKKFQLHCDASEKGMGSVLTQEGRVIGYYSRKFRDAELNYTIVEKEYFAILLSLLHFEDIIQGCYIEVYTDSNNCTFEFKSPTSRVLRWKVLLSKFDYTLQHVKGEENAIADQLSRCFLMTDEDNIKLKYDKAVYQAAKKVGGSMVTDEKGRVVIKNIAKKGLITFIHNLCGHRGVSTMNRNLKDNLRITGISGLLKAVTKACKVCKRYKVFVRTFQAKSQMKAESIFQRVSSDVYGPFTLENFISSEEKVGYVLTLTDIFSRITRLHYLKSVDGDAIVRAMRSWNEEFKKPAIFISDNGTQYKSKVLKNYLEENSIRHILVPCYTPSSNGISERLNKTISFILSISKGEHIRDAVQRAESTLNLNYNRNLGVVPLNLLTQKDFYDPLNRPNEFVIRDYVPEVSSKIKVGDIVYKRVTNASKLQPKYGKKRRVVEVGDKGVWVKLEGEEGWTHSKNLKL